MREVIIPSNMNPWMCNINGVVYSYTAGSTQTVPDEVASLIDAINAEKPVATHPGNAGDVWTMQENGEAAWIGGGGGGDEPDLVIGFSGSIMDVPSESNVSIVTGSIKAFVEKFETEGNAKCVVRYCKVYTPNFHSVYEEITNVNVYRYDDNVWFKYPTQNYGDVCFIDLCYSVSSGELVSCERSLWTLNED